MWNFKDFYTHTVYVTERFTTRRFHFFSLIIKQGVNFLTLTKQYLENPGEKWGIECLNHGFPLSILLYAGNVKILYVSSFTHYPAHCRVGIDNTTKAENNKKNKFIYFILIILNNTKVKWVITVIFLHSQ